MKKNQQKKNDDDIVRGFMLMHKCGYDHKTKPEILVGLYARSGGTQGEFTMLWEEISGKLSPCISLFDDAWQLFEAFSDLFKELSNIQGTDPSAEIIEKLLLRLGYEDFTEYPKERLPVKCFAVRIQTAGNAVPSEIFPSLNAGHDNIHKGIILLDGESPQDIYYQYDHDERIQAIEVLGEVENMDAYLSYARKTRK